MGFEKDFMANTSAASKSSTKAKTKKKKLASSAVNGYDRYKIFDGTQYTGMPIGKSHKWYYDKGEWHEKKIRPDRWAINYSVIKRRAGHAPEESGVPVGTGYHWFILGHQFVHKLDANNYTTHMIGIKLKLAHKRAGNDKWNISDNTQQNHLIKLLEEFVAELKADSSKLDIIPLDFTYKEKNYTGMAIPLMDSCINGRCNEFDIILNEENKGILRCTKNGWRMTHLKPQSLVNAIAEIIFLWYE
jgi:hypothetical protein